MIQRLSHQFAAFTMAAVMTLALLGGVDGLATSQPSDTLVAHVMQGSAKT